MPRRKKTPDAGRSSERTVPDAETFTGHAPTPDQDRVDEMGAAAGLTYKDNEPLQFARVARRDKRRWELDPRSGQEEQAMDQADDKEEDDEDAAAAADAPLRFWDLADDLDAEAVEADDDDEDDADDEDDEDDEEDDELEDDEDAAPSMDDDLEPVEADGDEAEDELDEDEADDDLDDLEEDEDDDDDDDDDD